MLFGRHVAQHRSTVPADHRRADGACDVIVTRSDIRDKRTERVERRLLAHLDFFVYLQLDLVHRYVAGTFNHHLNVEFPSLSRQFSQNA